MRLVDVDNVFWTNKSYYDYYDRWVSLIIYGDCLVAMFNIS